MLGPLRVTRLLAFLVPLHLACAAPSLLAAVDGTYDGSTGQALSVSITVSGNKITDVTLFYDCAGAGGEHATFPDGCALTGTTFDCGNAVCIPIATVATFRLRGAFICGNVSGTFDLVRKPDNVSPCCSFTFMPFSAALQGGPPMIGLDPMALPDGSVGAGYAAMVSASGGTPPYQYSVSNGGLPDGLSLDSYSGAIDGIPTSGGFFSFEISAGDPNFCFGSRTYGVTITDPCAGEVQAPLVSPPAPATVLQSLCS